jgi:hypothetical protein
VATRERDFRATTHDVGAADIASPAVHSVPLTSEQRGYLKGQTNPAFAVLHAVLMAGAWSIIPAFFVWSILAKVPVLGWLLVLMTLGAGLGLALCIFPFAFVWFLVDRERYYLAVRRDRRSGQVDRFEGTFTLERRAKSRSGRVEVTGATLHGAGVPIDIGSSAARRLSGVPEQLRGSVDVAPNSRVLLAIRGAEGTLLYDAPSAAA